MWNLSSTENKENDEMDVSPSMPAVGAIGRATFQLQVCALPKRMYVKMYGSCRRTAGL